MLSFVVQNFYTNNTIVRTKKYNHMVLLSSARLFFLFIKTNIHTLFYRQDFLRIATTILHIYNRNFIKPLWAALISLDDFRYGLCTNNLSKSLTYHTLKSLTNPRKGVELSNEVVSRFKSDQLTAYTHHIPTLSFAFNKDLYNNVMIYFLHFLVKYYAPAQLHFTLMYNFLIIPNTFALYPFCNSFCFRIWNY